MRKNVFTPLVIALIVMAVLICGAVAFLVYKQKPTTTPKGVFCTMGAKQCPDGSYVGRSGPDCAFAKCSSTSPTPAPAPDQTCGGATDGSCPKGYRCIQDCGPPVVRADSPPPSYRCVADAIANKPRMCPICLASNTKIATPNGSVNVKDIKEGMRVWSVDMSDKKIASVVIAVSHTPVPKTHQVVHLVLSDGREVWVSPGHPTITGMSAGELRVGASYDGARVQSADLVPYRDDATYDLLPDSATGAYWANGILLGSTLKR